MAESIQSPLGPLHTAQQLQQAVTQAVAEAHEHARQALNAAIDRAAHYAIVGEQHRQRANALAAELARVKKAAKAETTAPGGDGAEKGEA